MKMTNYEIYTNTEKLLKVFSEEESQKLPIKLSFCIQRNMKKLRELAEEIEKTRMSLLEQYGEKTDNGGYSVPAENIEIVNREFGDLMSIEQDVNITTIKIDSISDDVQLTNAEMDAIMFMIEEE